MTPPGWITRAAASKELLLVNGGLARFVYRSRDVLWIKDLMVPPDSVLGEVTPGEVELVIFRILALQPRVRFIDIMLPAAQTDGAVNVLMRNEAATLKTTLEHNVMTHWWRMDVRDGVKDPFGMIE